MCVCVYVFMFVPECLHGQPQVNSITGLPVTEEGVEGDKMEGFTAKHLPLLHCILKPPGAECWHAFVLKPNGEGMLAPPPGAMISMQLTKASPTQQS